MPKFILKINQSTDAVYDDDAICCYLLDTSLGKEFISKFNAQDKMKLLCGKNATELCGEYQADGILFEPDLKQPLKVQIKKARTQIGKKVLGVVICPRRHEAMLAGETEPEFVAFSFSKEESNQAKEVISWYNELFLIQSALDMEKEVLADAASYDTDFIIINSRDYKDFGC